MDSFRVAQVTAQTVTKAVLDYSVSGNGKVESSRELAVFTVPEMKVSSLNVQEGEQVKKGELLFQVDLKYVKEKEKFSDDGIRAGEANQRRRRQSG